MASDGHWFVDLLSVSEVHPGQGKALAGSDVQNPVFHCILTLLVLHAGHDLQDSCLHPGPARASSSIFTLTGQQIKSSTTCVLI